VENSTRSAILSAIHVPGDVCPAERDERCGPVMAPVKDRLLSLAIEITRFDWKSTSGCDRQLRGFIYSTTVDAATMRGLLGHYERCSRKW